MGILDRLGNVIKSYLNDFGEEVSHGRTPRGNFGGKHSDPDFNAAYEELDDFLNNREKPSDREAYGEEAGFGKKRAPPLAELSKDFAELGLSPEATLEECKAEYKKLLKIHHPDKHAGHADNMKKATEKSALVNAAYTRLENWFKGRF